MQSARSKLLDLEVVLREQWYDSVEVAPTLAARLTVAARLIRNAAEALASDTVL